jgi:hypothetical protein
MRWDGLQKWCARWLPSIAAFIVIIGAIYAGVKYVARAELSGMANDISTIKSTLQPLPDAIHALENRMTRMETHWDDLKLKELSTQTPSKDTVDAVKTTLQEAKAANLRLSIQVIEEAGNRFLVTARRDRVAWDAALEFFTYRSFLNVDFLPLALTPSSGKSNYRQTLRIIPNPDHPEMHQVAQVLFAGGYASPDKSARLEALDQPQPTGSEFAFFIIDGRLDTIVLDGEFMKHVIIRNADVQYDGDRVRLEDVYFVNCIFHSRFKFAPRTFKLGEKLLASASINFPVRPSVR